MLSGITGRSSAEPGGPIRVLVVDDSAFMRFTITRYLGEEEGLLVVGTARNGREAIDAIPKLQPDVITLDVEMPVMDGLSTLRAIMSSQPRPVIMLSSLTKEGALETVQALTLGAVDFVAKPDNKANVGQVMAEVAAKIRQAVKARVWRIARSEAPKIAVKQPAHKMTLPFGNTDRVVVIGASTGGPRALASLIPQLSPKSNAAYVIVQHMPVGFTRSMAERLDLESDLCVKEACPGDHLEAGLALVAPGGFHMTFDRSGIVALNQNPPVHGVRPAIDVTMTSIARYFGQRAVAVILTGMGSDGTTGSSLIRAAGGHVIAEAESSCVVWGMPRSVAEAGAAHEIHPLAAIPQAIERLLARRNSFEGD